MVNGQARTRVARLTASGAVEGLGDFNPGSGADYPVYSVAVQADGKIVVAGGFVSFDDSEISGVARLNPTGSLDTSFDPTAGFMSGAGTDGYDAYGVSLQANGQVLLVGPFESFDGEPYRLVARLLNDGATQNLSAVATQVQWLRGAAAPEASRVTFELSTNGGSTWSLLGSGSRVASGWQLPGLNLPPAGSIRARGFASGGYSNGSAGIVERIQTYTLPAAPVALTLAASSVTSSTAVLNGTVNANGSSTEVSFDYGTTIAYGTNLAGTPPTVTGGSATTVSVALTSLTPGTTYHFQVKGVSAGGIALGGDLTFTTLDNAGPTGGTMTLAPASPVAAGAALTVTFAGWIDPSAPLTYAVLVDDVVVSSQGASASRNLAGPTAAGPHVLKGRIFDALGNVTEVTQNFTVQTASESWRQLWFGSPANSGDGADDAMPDGDGIKNLMKYALLIDPGASGSDLLPQAQRRIYAEGPRLAVTFNRAPARNDITIYVEAADTLAGLSTSPTILATSVNGAPMSGVGVVGETDIGGGTRSAEVRDIINMGTAPRRFLRIRVER